MWRIGVLLCLLGILCMPAAQTYAQDAGDDYTSAVPIPIDGTETEGILGDNADEDWYSFGTNDYGLYRVTIIASSGFKYAEVLALSGTTLTRIVMPGASAGNTSQQTIWLPTADTYFVRVFYQAGVYRVSVEEIGVYPPDSYSNICTTAETLTVDAPPTVGTIGPLAVDEDWFTFETTPLTKYEITMTRVDNTAYQYYDIVAGDCTNKVLSSQTAPRTYVSWFGEDVKLRLFTGATNQPGWYTIQVQSLGPVSDDHGNVYADATPIPIDGSQVGGAIQYQANVQADEDWFSFDTNTDGLYRLSLTTYAGAKSIRLHSLNGSLSQLITFSESNGVEERTVFLPQADTYYLQVLSTQDGVYEVSVEEVDLVPADTYPDSCGAAPGPLVIAPDPSPVVGTLSSAIDNDWFVFHAQRLHKYQITLVNDDLASTYYDLFADCFNDIRRTQQNLTLVAQEDRDFYIRVFPYQSRQYYYELTLADLGLQEDDHANDAAGATEVTPNGFANGGLLQYSATLYADEDWFVFTAAMDSTYEITQQVWAGSKTLQVYEEQANGQPGTNPVLQFSSNQTRPLDVTGGRRYFVRISGSEGGYQWAAQAPLALCGDIAHPYPAFDFNQDCYVDLADFAIFAAEWASCTDPNPPCNYNP